ATFLTGRAYEQIRVDVCMHNLPVRLIGNGGGCVYSPLGPTHLAIEDIAIMRALPNMTVVAPCDAEEMVGVMEASLDYPGPMYIRMARGGEPVVSVGDDFEIGKATVLYRPMDRGYVLLVSTGAMSHNCLLSAVALSGVDCALLHYHTIKPFDATALCYWASHSRA